MKEYRFIDIERSDNGTRQCDIVYSKNQPDMPDKALLPETLFEDWEKVQPCFNIMVENGVVTSVTDDPEGRVIYEKWVEDMNNKPDVPEDDPEVTDDINYDELAAAIQEGVNEV